MAQGKLKVKSKLPSNNKRTQKRGTPATKRANAPIKPKKQKFENAHKLKQAITKTVNKAVEEEMRSKAGRSTLNLSKAQQAVAKYNKNVGKEQSK